MKRKCAIAYLIGVPSLAAIYCSVYLPLTWHTVAIGDTANPVISPVLGISLAILNFPMMYLYVPLGDWLEQFLTDNGVLYLFAGINGLVWGAIVASLTLWIMKRIGDPSPALDHRPRQ